MPHLLKPTISLDVRAPAVSVYTDGACSNSGTRAYHGGHAAIIVWEETEKIVRGHEYPATNSTMELQALISALKALQEPCWVDFYSDARYLVDGFSKWLVNWIEKGWPSRIENQKQWKEIAHLATIHDIRGTWIRGHAKQSECSPRQAYNIRCDEMAVEEAWACFEERRHPKETENG